MAAKRATSSFRGRHLETSLLGRSEHAINLPHDPLGPLNRSGDQRFGSRAWCRRDRRRSSGVAPRGFLPVCQHVLAYVTGHQSLRKWKGSITIPCRGGIHGKANGTAVLCIGVEGGENESGRSDRKSTRLNSSHLG